jgi:hypothetical protein
MKKCALLLAMLVTTFAVGYSQADSTSFMPKDGFVPNAETAVKIAEAVLIPVYGEKQILAERPFNVVRKGDVWIVSGTLPCEPCAGGTAEVTISKSSGQILRMIHYK